MPCMSAVLIAVILALVLGHAAPQLIALRRYGVFAQWIDWLGARLGTQGLHGSPYAVLLSLGLPLLLIGLVQGLLDGRLYGLASFAFATAVLFWCWAPRRSPRRPGRGRAVPSTSTAPPGRRRMPAAHRHARAAPTAPGRPRAAAGPR